LLSCHGGWMGAYADREDRSRYARSHRNVPAACDTTEHSARHSCSVLHVLCLFFPTKIDLSCHFRLIERAMYCAKELVDPRSLTKLVDRYLFSCILLLPEHPGVGPISALLLQTRWLPPCLRPQVYQRWPPSAATRPGRQAPRRQVSRSAIYDKHPVASAALCRHRRVQELLDGFPPPGSATPCRPRPCGPARRHPSPLRDHQLLCLHPAGVHWLLAPR